MSHVGLGWKLVGERLDDDLLNTAVATLAANPGASLQEIAERAGISRATLHRRFAGRDELVLAIGDWAIGQVEQISASVEERSLVGRAALEAILEQGIALAPKLGFLISEHSLEYDVTFMARVEAAMTRWHHVVEEGQRRGEIRIDLPARWIVDAIEGLFIAVFHGQRRGFTAPADALRLVRLTLLEGILAAPTTPTSLIVSTPTTPPTPA